MDTKLIPNSTQIPNIILDLLVPKLPEAEGKCLLYISRRTFGFHKDEDVISFTQFINGIKDKSGKVLDHGTGLSRVSVNEGLKNLAKAKAIYIEKNSKGNRYKINLEMDIDKVVSEIYQYRKLTNFGKVSKPKQVCLPYQQKKEKQRETKYMRPAQKEPSAHSEFIKFFHDNCFKIRGVKPVITGADCRNLKRVLDLGIVKQNELEQIAVYFLSDRYYKKFAPSISTFLSAGILNGLVDSLKNRETFWKELDGYMVKFTERQAVKSDSLAGRLLQMKSVFIQNKKITHISNDYD